MDEQEPARFICRECEHLWDSTVPPHTVDCCEECPCCGRMTGTLVVPSGTRGRKDALDESGTRGTD